MKTTLFIIMFLAAAIVLLPAAIFEASDVRLRAFTGLDDVRRGDGATYDPMAERMFEGTIASKGHVVDGLMYFPMKTADNVMEVQIGPKEFVELSGFKPKSGQTVIVIGMPMMLEGRQVLLAREVLTRASVFVVRDRDGAPMWDPNRPILMDPEFPESVMCEMIKPWKTSPF